MGRPRIGKDVLAPWERQQRARDKKKRSAILASAQDILKKPLLVAPAVNGSTREKLGRCSKPSSNVYAHPIMNELARDATNDADLRNGSYVFGFAASESASGSIGPTLRDLMFSEPGIGDGRSSEYVRNSSDLLHTMIRKEQYPEP